ncbi:MAG: 4a-hydroxytetrahydrobiopterin dehydratase [Gammaproteobacteria bacterium]|nr:4a-hydroxytetrahydrobiopterin dehydratase [Gammaproteobacteria bacterium]MDH5728134.1 4a-hydroxytetrahydrobiopterin dehydratase [Gammaproteobacteria bacterium]
MTLSAESCIPCRGGIPPMEREAAENLLPQAKAWRLNDTATKISRGYDFDNFVDALAFTNKVGALAEEQGHHPDICLGWGYCEVTFYSHKINGLHQNDFIMAAKTNEIYQAK